MRTQTIVARKNIITRKNVLTYHLSVPHSDQQNARIDIQAGDGNLMIDRLNGGEGLLAGGELQYLENQDLPNWTVDTSGGQACLELKRTGPNQRWFRLPWAACSGATEWNVHLNPAVTLDITAHSDGGNILLDLAGMAVSRVSADTGGGNLEVVLPEPDAYLIVSVKTGAGNVTVRIPGDAAACIHPATGLGKVTVDPRFSKIDNHTYQSTDFEHATQRVEITANSGAGNVMISTIL